MLPLPKRSKSPEEAWRCSSALDGSEKEGFSSYPGKCGPTWFNYGAVDVSVRALHHRGGCEVLVFGNIVNLEENQNRRKSGNATRSNYLFGGGMRTSPN